MQEIIRSGIKKSGIFFSAQFLLFFIKINFIYNARSSPFGVRLQRLDVMIYVFVEVDNISVVLDVLATFI